MRQWFTNIILAVATIARGLLLTAKAWLRTYDRGRKTYTERYHYPETPLSVAARYRGFHRFDLTTCIGCDQCAKVCPVDCIYIGKERVVDGKGFAVESFTIDYTKCLMCALCVEPCPVDCIFMGATHDLSSYSRDGSVVDFAKLPVEIAWGRATLNPTVVALSKSCSQPAHQGPNRSRLARLDSPNSPPKL